MAATYWVTRPSGPATSDGHIERLDEPARQLGALRKSDHGNDAPAQHRPEDLALDVAGGDAPPPCASEACLLAQDLRVQLLKLGARLDPELVDERAARVAERLQRLRLPAAAVEREHPERADPLAQRCQRGERLELADRPRGEDRARCPRRCAPRARRAVAPRAAGSRPA